MTMIRFSSKLLVALSVSSMLLSGCITVGKQEQNKLQGNKVKNVILMIGDGMGAQQIGLLEEYARRAPNSVYNERGNVTALQLLGETGSIGLSLTAPQGRDGALVVDSACSATQLATGLPAGSEMIGLNDQGYVVETILEKAKAQGKATGLVSDTRITHATPAAFASHQPHRSLENKIAEQLIEGQSVDVMLSGGARYFLPNNIKSDMANRQAMAEAGAPKSIYRGSKRRDDRNLIIEAKNEYGYQLAFDNVQLAKAQGSKLLGLFANSGMADAISNKACQQTNSCVQPTLREMTLKALEILSQDEDGFFLMVEGGQIDWAGHINDAGWMLNELVKFDEAVAAVHEWVKDRNDTLVVVTGDHETGGFGFSYSMNDLPQPQQLAGEGMTGKAYHPNFNFGQVSTLDKLYQQKGTFHHVLSLVDPTRKFTDTTAKQWADAINAVSEFKVTEQQAEMIRQREDNSYFTEGHKYLSLKRLPLVRDFKEFYVYGNDSHGNLIGRALAAKQNIVWGTGTHTAAPVPVYAFGPANLTQKFSTMQRHMDVSQKMMEALLSE